MSRDILEKAQFALAAASMEDAPDYLRLVNALESALSRAEAAEKVCEAYEGSLNANSPKEWRSHLIGADEALEAWRKIRGSHD